MAIGSITPFRPTGTASLSAGTSSATVALAVGGDSIVVTNTTASLAYVRFGADPSVSASVADMPVMANSRAMLSTNNLVTHGAAVLALAAAQCCSPAATDPKCDAIHGRRKDGHSSILWLPRVRGGELGIPELAIHPGLWLAGIPDE